MARIASQRRPQRNFLGVYDLMLKAIMLDYADCARYEASGYADFIGKLYTLPGGMFQSPVVCDRTLTQMMLHYLAWFQDPGLRLVVGPGAAWRATNGCRTQRYGDALYVVEAAPAAPVCVGERITGVNGRTLDAIRPEVERTLHTTVEPSDSEREDWSLVLMFAKHLTVEGAGGAERTVVATWGDGGAAAGEPADPACTLHSEDGVAIVRLTHPGASKFGEELAGALRELGGLMAEGVVEGLVIDARGAEGGVQEDIYPLVRHLLAPGARVRPADLFGRPGVLMNYSRRNVDAKLAELAALRPQLAAQGPGVAGEVEELDTLVADLTPLRGRGFVPDEADWYGEMAFELPADLGLPAGARPVVLVDRRTADAAEWLARAAKASGHALVVGRSTAGSLDNTCPRMMRFDADFSLVVPTAKYLAALDGAATLGRGVVLDVHVPWTPEHLVRDVDLAEAIKAARGA